MPVMPSQLPLILPKDSNIMSIVQALTPKLPKLDNNLMPPPSTMQDNTTEENANKKLKFKGMSRGAWLFKENQLSGNSS